MMLETKVISRIKALYDGSPLVIEGANGSLGLSLLRVLVNLKIRPSALLLTTYDSEPDVEWSALQRSFLHIKASNKDFLLNRDEIIRSFPRGVNVIYGAGYGQPQRFMSNPSQVISANVTSILGYASFSNVASFALLSTSELYTGAYNEVTEDGEMSSRPQHPRAIYIESKRLAEAITGKILTPVISRCCSYRVALALPPKLLRNDSRVFADLVRSGITQGVVHLRGGSELRRQYQYGPNAAYKLLGSMANGSSRLYNNAGSHLVTLGELAVTIAKVLGTPYRLDDVHKDDTSPKLVHLDDSLIRSESGYITEQEQSLETYISQIIHDSSSKTLNL